MMRHAKESEQSALSGAMSSKLGTRGFNNNSPGVASSGDANIAIAAPAARPVTSDYLGKGNVGGADPYISNSMKSARDAIQNEYGAANGGEFKFPTGGAPAHSDLNAELGRRMLESPKTVAPADPSKPNPYAWMGRADEQRAFIQEENRDKFDVKEINAIKQVAVEPVSTFSIDVDTASYAFARRALNAGRLPPKDAVRVEEMINYFPYAYPAPETADVPFKPAVTVMPSPWNANNKLVHVAIKGYDLKNTERPRANLVFLMDVSGSMAPADRLPLVKNAFRMLVEQLKPDDTMAIVTYASGSGIALEPTKISDKAKILRAIDQLGAGGSTAGAAGISDAYRLAEAGFDKSAVNRVILATDGDFNVGITDQGALKSFIERKRQSGIFLSVLGVGQGNHNDALMQTLAQNGNGTAAYADTLSEARKVLVEESSSTLFTIAKDVKAQIEWNPARVAEYRLIGYETRALKREDFNNDKVDAGDIGSGHTVTAIYEITPVGATLMSDALRYGQKTAAVAPVPNEPADAKTAAASNELGFLKLRYKRPNEDTSQLITLPLTDALAKSNMTEVPAEQRFSIAVAAFAQMLKGESYIQGYTADEILALAQSARGDDPFGYRAEFLNLVRLAKSAQP
ncbi:MAG: VWA domain-containing protein [Hyphomicrobium sp.]|nr:VWA domain-containing protein [Hyphomicrobium sp.]